MNEVALAKMADRLVEMHERDGIGAYLTTDPDMTGRDAELLTAELVRRGVNMVVFVATSVTIR